MTLRTTLVRFGRERTRARARAHTHTHTHTHTYTQTTDTKIPHTKRQESKSLTDIGAGHVTDVGAVCDDVHGDGAVAVGVDDGLVAGLEAGQLGVVRVQFSSVVVQRAAARSTGAVRGTETDDFHLQHQTSAC